MNYPTAEQIRVAVQKDLQMSGQPLIAAVTEASHGIGGPVYHVAFAPAEVTEAVSA